MNISGRVTAIGFRPARYFGIYDSASSDVGSCPCTRARKIDQKQRDEKTCLKLCPMLSK